MRNLLPRLWANWLTLFGSVLCTLSGLALALFVAMDLAGPGRNPYAGSFVILILPMLLVLGLLMVPAGLWWDRRKRPSAPGAVEQAFQTALHDKRARNLLLFFAAATLANVLLIGFAGKSSIEYMDSPKFCGGACHTVMQPEWRAYQKSPHANVDCVECHIAAGTTSFVKAKVNGIGQMAKLFTNRYHRPVVPPEHLDGGVCIHCHSKQTLGDKLKVYPHYKPDKDNSPAFNVMVLHVGGREPKSGDYHGIHWHASPDVEIRYDYLDPARSKIGAIRVSRKGKLVGEYLPPGAPQTSAGERKMDCIDCHNRPTHIFDASPAAALDRAFADGRLDAKVPSLAQIAADLLVRPDGRRADAEAFFATALADAYRVRQIPLSGEQAAATAKVLAEIYRTNVYPELKLGWGSYRNNLGHAGDGGCFRCHDGQHTMKLADGSPKALGQDCDACHERVALDEDPKNLDDTTKLLLPR